METFTSRSKNSKQDNRERYNKIDSVDSKLKQLKINSEKTDLTKNDEANPDMRVVSTVGKRTRKFHSNVICT